jgi:hypothetical protein
MPNRKNIKHCAAFENETSAKKCGKVAHSKFLDREGNFVGYVCDEHIREFAKQKIEGNAVPLARQTKYKLEAKNYGSKV